MSDAPQLSVLVAYRDREVSRIERLFKSFSQHTKTAFEFLVCDFGSREPFRSELIQASKAQGFSIVRLEAEGLPWNKAMALNTGARQAKAPWILVVDADMVFYDPVVDHVLSRIRSEEMWLLETIWPQWKLSQPLKGKHLKSPGVFQIMHRDWFEKLQGYCEDFEFWGHEDSDWVRRAEQAGCQLRWLSADEFRVVHQWHPRQNNSVTRPFTAVYEALETEVRHAIEGHQNTHWGREIRRTDRPILDRMGSQSTDSIDLLKEGQSRTMTLLHEKVQSGAVVKVSLGPRVGQRALVRFSSLLFFLRGAFGFFSLKLEPDTRQNLEAVLLFRRNWGRDRLDVFIDHSLTEVYLCKR